MSSANCAITAPIVQSDGTKDENTFATVLSPRFGAGSGKKMKRGGQLSVMGAN